MGNNEDIARLSPLGYEHLNFLGRFNFELAVPIAQGGAAAIAPTRNSTIKSVAHEIVYWRF
jgi:hypothetical protein